MSGRLASVRCKTLKGTRFAGTGAAFCSAAVQKKNANFRRLSYELQRF
jgi:hypothetical protein